MTIFVTVMIGLCCLVLFAMTVLPVLVLIPSALIKCNFMILHQSSNRDEDKQLNGYEIQTITDIMLASSLLTPCLTFITILLFQQVFGDRITLTLLLCYWLLPILLTITFKFKWTHNKYIMYIVWLLSMYVPLVSMIVYSFPEYFFSISNFYVKINFYLKLISDICLVIVTVSDFIYSNLITINWSKMYQQKDNK